MIRADVFIAPSADVIGDVRIKSLSSVLYQTVLRGDHNTISIGCRSNVQDGCIIHCDPDEDGGFPVNIGDNVSIGHGARLHGCRIEDDCLIGIGAIILDGAVIGKGSLIGAGALITATKKIPPRSVVMGMPGKIIREVNDTETALIKKAADMYVELNRKYFATEKHS